MKSNTIKLGLFALALCSISFVNAQEMETKEKKKQNPEKAFKKMDADANGTISLEEFKEKRMKDESKADRIEKRFAKMDTDGNGSLDMAEFEASMNKMKKKKMKMKNKEDK